MDPNETRARKKAPGSRTSKYEKFKRDTGTKNTFLYLKACDPHLLQDAIESVTANGDMISFTRTSDGNALCITVTADGERYKQYAADDETLVMLLESLT